ncbi:MAG TPA: urease accessory protein UreD [Polyangiaceae bacterium]|nr:urease accessory protein UreD [Polyangiaceae bacterium]
MSEHSHGWQARLDLELIHEAPRTRLGHRSHFGPLRIQRPFYPEGEDRLHLYLLHPPGGLVGGDSLEISVTSRAGAHGLLTTPSAQKVYRTIESRSSQRVVLHVEGHASLEWLPSETLIFDGAAARLETRVELAKEASFIGWEIGCFGRPASQAPFAQGDLFQSFEIYCAGEPVIVDRLRMRGGSEALQAAYGQQGYPAYGTLYCVVPSAVFTSSAAASNSSSVLGDGSAPNQTPGPASSTADWLTTLRGRLGEQARATAFENAVVVRARAEHVELVRHELVRAWACLRELALGRPPSLPRIWAT